MLVSASRSLQSWTTIYNRTFHWWPNVKAGESWTQLMVDGSTFISNAILCFPANLDSILLKTKKPLTHLHHYSQQDADLLINKIKYQFWHYSGLICATLHFFQFDCWLLTLVYSSCEGRQLTMKICKEISYFSFLTNGRFAAYCWWSKLLE